MERGGRMKPRSLTCTIGGAVTKLPAATLKQLQARLHEHSLQMATLRAALDIQLTRIAQMQAELDLLPHARKRRLLLRALLTKQFVDHGTGVC